MPTPEPQSGVLGHDLVEQRHVSANIEDSFRRLNSAENNKEVAPGVDCLRQPNRQLLAEALRLHHLQKAVDVDVRQCIQNVPELARSFAHIDEPVDRSTSSISELRLHHTIGCIPKQK